MISVITTLKPHQSLFIVNPLALGCRSEDLPSLRAGYRVRCR